MTSLVRLATQKPIKEDDRVCTNQTKKDNKKKDTGGGDGKDAVAVVKQLLAKRLEEKANAGSGGSKSAKAVRKLMEDDCFGSLFTQEDFAIDEEDENQKKYVHIFLGSPRGYA